MHDVLCASQAVTNLYIRGGKRLQSIPMVFVPLIFAFPRPTRGASVSDVSSFTLLSTLRKWTVNRPRYAAFPFETEITQSTWRVPALMETRRATVRRLRYRIIDF